MTPNCDSNGIISSAGKRIRLRPCNLFKGIVNQSNRSIPNHIDNCEQRGSCVRKRSVCGDMTNSRCTSTILFLLKTIWSNWSKRRVVKPGSLQNHRNSADKSFTLHLHSGLFSYFTKFNILPMRCFPCSCLALWITRPAIHNNKNGLHILKKTDTFNPLNSNLFLPSRGFDLPWRGYIDDSARPRLCLCLSVSTTGSDGKRTDVLGSLGFHYKSCIDPIPSSNMSTRRNAIQREKKRGGKMPSLTLRIDREKTLGHFSCVDSASPVLTESIPGQLCWCSY